MEQLTESPYKGATIRKVAELAPIDGADKIEVATIDGWKVVVKKGEFKVNDLGCFIEIDTWLPVHPAWEFLDKAPRDYIGYGLGYRVRSIKLRKQLSQGVFLPIASLMKDLYGAFDQGNHPTPVKEGDDVSLQLGARHWEKPIPASQQGSVRGSFPSFIPKTDQERVQNIKNYIFGDTAQYRDTVWEISTKMDGSSITIYHNNGDVGVCSRNQSLKLQDLGSVFVRTAIETGIVDILKKTGKNWAIQGELVGPGIQDNHEGLGRPDIFVFDIYDIDEQKYLPPYLRQAAVLSLGLRHVPATALFHIKFESMDNILEGAKGPSMLAEQREGLVYKHETGEFSFKAINNDFLLAKGE